MSATELERYMTLTTKIIEGNIIEGEKVMWEVTVMGPSATATLLNLIPEDEDINTAKFIKENYFTIATKIIHPCIVKPKIPVERLTLADVNLIFPVLYDMSFPRGEDDGFRGQ